jgi:hypothetical protein
MMATPAHGALDLFFGWSAIALGSAATLYTIVAAIYWSVCPGEEAPDHPKRLILRRDR